MADLATFSDAEFENDVLKADKPVLIDFWAEWCVPCRHIAPLVEQVSKEYAGKLKVGKMDVDSNPQTPGMYGIVSIPTLLMFKNGELVDRRVGALSLKDLKKFVDENL